MVAREYITRECVYVYRSVCRSESIATDSIGRNPRLNSRRVLVTSIIIERTNYRKHRCEAPLRSAAFQANFPSDYVSCHFVSATSPRPCLPLIFVFSRNVRFNPSLSVAGILEFSSARFAGHCDRVSCRIVRRRFHIFNRIFIS